MNSQMYREHILDLYKNPLNFGSLKNATHEHTLNNPLCGDEITIQLIMEDNKIKDIKFKGIGCAISIASTSLLTDKIKGMKIKDINKITSEETIKMLHIPISYVRMKCATLSLEAVKEALI